MAGPGIISFIRTEKYSNQVVDELKCMFEENVLTDFSIHIKDRSIRCHKVVLAIHSPVLKAMLTTDMIEASKQAVRLDHINYNIMALIVEYMYCGTVSFHKDQLQDMVSACNYLQMTQLQEMNIAEIPETMDTKNVLSWLKTSAEIELQCIVDKCKKVLADHFEQISKQAEFLHLKFADLQDCLDVMDDIGVSNDDTLSAVMNWANHDVDERCVHLENLLEQIFLDACSMKNIIFVMNRYADLITKNNNVYKLLTHAIKQIAEEEDPNQVQRKTLVIVGGVDQTLTCNQLCWQLKSQKTERKMSFPDLCPLASVCKTKTGFIFSGGKNSKECFSVNFNAIRYQELPDMLTERWGHGSLCIKDVLYVFGGCENDDESNTWCENDDKSNTVAYLGIESRQWTQGPFLPFPVRYPKVANLDDSVYLFDQNTNRLLHMNVDRKWWHGRAQLPGRKCDGVSMTAGVGMLFVAGGQHICAWYKPLSDTWCTGKQPLREHYYGAVTYYEGKFLLGGGSKHRTDEIEEYDVEKDSWGICSFKMPALLSAHSFPS